jgi:hypothetical protein
MLGLLIILALAVAVAVVVSRLRTADAKARFLQRSGLVLMAVFTIVGALWIAAEAFDDPGGWQAAGMTAAWLVPLIGLSLVAWYRDAWATVVLTVLTTSAIGLNVWVIADPEWWRSFENDHGPVRAITSFALAAPVAVHGRTRPLPSGVLLLALAVLPMVMSAVGGVAGLGSLSVVSLPILATGVLYLSAAAITRRGSGGRMRYWTHFSRVRPGRRPG